MEFLEVAILVVFLSVKQLHFNKSSLLLTKLLLFSFSSFLEKLFLMRKFDFKVLELYSTS
jgi:hypothetical protein